MVRIKFIENWRKSWKEKTRKKKAELLYKVPEKLIRVFGLRTYTDDKIFWYAYYSNVIIFLCVICYVYTVYRCIVNHQIHGALVPFCVSGCIGTVMQTFFWIYLEGNVGLIAFY